MSIIELTEHQLEQAQRIIDAGNDGVTYLPLTGRAGTGKTTVLDRLGIMAVREGPWRQVIYMTTTGRSKWVLSQKVQADVRTFHSYVYGRGDEEKVPLRDHDGNVVFEADGETPIMRRTGKLFFGSPREDLPTDTLYACDEASLMNMRRKPDDRPLMYDDIMRVLPRGSAFMPVGDYHQLPPVVGQSIPGFRPGDKPLAELKEIHRQAWDNPVIRIADKLAQGIPMSRAYERTQKTEKRPQNVGMAAGWLVEHIRNEEDATLITGTNKSRQKLNNRVRKLLGHDKKDILVVDDRMVALVNDHERQLMNGETFHIVKIDEIETLANFDLCFLVWRENDPMPMIMQAGTIGATKERWAAFRDLLFARYRRSSTKGTEDMYKLQEHLAQRGHSYAASLLNPEFMTHQENNDLMRGLFTWSDYGFALTGHKSQGSEWPHVGYYRDDWIARFMDADLRQKADYTIQTRTSDDFVLFG